MTCTPGDLSKLLNLAFSQDGCRRQARSRLGHALNDLIPERRHEPLELSKTRIERKVIDVWQFHTDDYGFLALVAYHLSITVPGLWLAGGIGLLGRRSACN